MNIEQKLKNPFKPSAVNWRVGSTTKDKAKGIALAYLTSRDVMKRLDEVVGLENWEDSYFETASGRLLCTIKIKIDGEWFSKSDGAGDSAIEGAKGGISDAFKRAAVKFGCGRFLYSKKIQYLDSNELKTIAGKNGATKTSYPYCIDENGNRIYDLTKHINRKLSSKNRKLKSYP